MDTFWTHPDDGRQGIGFGQFSLTHFFLLILTAIFVAIIIKKYVDSDASSRLKMRKTIAIYLLVSEVFKLIVLGVKGLELKEYLPLEACSFAAYTIIIDAFTEDQKFWSKILLYLFFAGALMALVFPTCVVLPVFNYFTIHLFVFHGLIVAYALMRFFAKEVELDYMSLWKCVLVTLILVIIIYGVNTLLGSNYMFLMDTYDNYLLNIIWNITGGGLLYDVGFVVLCCIIVHIFYLVFKMISKVIA